ncbi:MAG: SIMPL domain-containing protein [Candidatus Azambacteria bacterium]|nr:SIMPL domain-containing protein [Candidatus Azambacteria bacterium]
MCYSIVTMAFDYNKLPECERRVVCATFVILALFLALAGFSQFVGALNNYRNGGAVFTPQTVSFIGEGKVTAAPDTAKAEIGLTTEGKDTISVQNENSSKMNAVIKFLKEQGIKEGNIKTNNYSLSPKYEYNKGKSTLVGYILNQNLTVSIRNLSKVGDILDGAVLNGANQINSISMFVDNPEELKNKAREEAVKQAKEKALAASQAAGFRLGRVIGFSENSAGGPPMFYEAMGKGGGEVAVAPQIEPGSQEIKINITLTYLIK